MNSGLVCVGLTTVDVVLRPVDCLPVNEATTLVEGIEIVPAGTAAGAALVAATLGMKTALVSAVGDDGKGRYVRMALEERGVNTRLLSVLPDFPTSASVLAVDSAGRRPVFHALGASFFAGINPEAIDAACRAKFLHWGGIGGPKMDGGAGASLVAAARAAGAIVTCDLISPQPTAFAELQRLLPHVDYFMPSVAEAFALADVNTLAAAADVFLGLGARTCIFKNGAVGSYLASGAERIALPAHDITPVDTTSCGDSYCAGFIAALDRGWPMIEACRFATASAALVAQGLGTLGKLQSFDATERAMREVPLRVAA